MAGTVYDDFTPVSEGVPGDSYPITPNDNADLPRPVRSFRANTGGVMRVIVGTGQERIINILGGETRYFVISKVFANGTTATGIEGMP